MGFPSTSNGLERANRSLKDDYTLRMKLGLVQFLQKIGESDQLLVKKGKEGALP